MRRDFWELIQFFPISRFLERAFFCKNISVIFFAFAAVSSSMLAGGREFFCAEMFLRRVSAAVIKEKI